MLQGYLQSAATLNLLRAFSQGGYADITRVHSWTLDFTAGQSGYEEYHKLANRISDALDFMGAAGVGPETANRCTGSTSTPPARGAAARVRGGALPDHSTTGVPVAGSGHMIWIGDRTASRRRHVEFARGVQNPIGLKCGPSITERPLEADRPAEPEERGAAHR